jgi:hypothetical protein
MSAAFDRLTRTELGLMPAAPPEYDPGPLEGYWHGSAAGHVSYWRARALRAEAALAALGDRERSG